MRKMLGFLGILHASFAMAQSPDFPLYHPAYQIIESADIRSIDGFSTSIKPYARKSVFDFSTPKTGSYLSKELREFSLDSLRSKSSILNYFYEYPADLFYYKDKTLDLHVNPALQFSYGKTNDQVGTTFTNTRGVEIRGTIDDKIAFYTFLSENQVRYPEYVNEVRDSTLAVPYEGFWKQYKETGVDFLRAQGYVDFGLSNSISAQLGYGKHFVGNGMRSLILSDVANNYPYLRINTQTKVFDYTNIFAELIADVDGNQGGTFGISGFSKKYLAFHHLNIKVKPNLHIGLFESVMYGDSTGGLKVEYMNPVIFYRSVEQQNGSEDNAIIGMDFKWNIRDRFSLYGQLSIDELVVSRAFSGDGWWGNKQGFQLGGKYADAFGFKDFIIQAELNKVRPYMYAHEDGYTSYSHYNLALAHPLGANFTEYIGRARYRVNDHWNFEMRAMKATYGNDIGSANYGRDILKDYTRRVPNPMNPSRNLDEGNSHLQGNKTELMMLFGRASYMWKHNLFVDIDATLRNEKDTNGVIDTSSGVFGISLRWNVQAPSYFF